MIYTTEDGGNKEETAYLRRTLATIKALGASPGTAGCWAFPRAMPLMRFQVHNAVLAWLGRKAGHVAVPRLAPGACMAAGRASPDQPA